MEADLQLLPPRKLPPSKLQFFRKPYKLHTNLYEVSLKKTPSLQQYTIQAEPEIGDEGVILLRRLIFSQKKQLANEIGMITFKGRILWATKKTTKVICLEVDKNLTAKNEKKYTKFFQKNQVLFIYSNIKNTKQQYDFSYDTFKNLVRASEYYAIRFDQPEFLEVKSYGSQAWIQQMLYFKQDIKGAWGNIKIVILLFANNEKHFYGQLKKFITNEFSLPCQVILKKTADNKNKASIFGKIALQINAKIGNTLWEVPPRHPFWKKKKLANGAFSVNRNIHQQTRKLKRQLIKQVESENRNSHVVGFVGTNSQNLSKIYSNAKMIANQKQLQEIQTFQDIIADWLKNCKHVQGFMPDILVVYRQGLTEKQVKTQAKAQIEAFHKVRVKYVDYTPQLIYILVTKRSSKRVYRGEKAQGTGKFIPQIMHNPYPGTIVFEQLSSPHVYDFHLAAQATTQGTATLTSYQIAYDASQIPEEAIAQFTMEQCYNYPNWQGGIKVPNCLQSADRLSRLVGEHIHQDIVDKQFDGQKIWHLRNTPFYL